MPKIADSSYGELYFEGNELIVRSLNDDPPKVRLEAPAGSLSKGLITWGTRRPDGRFEELALLQGKQDERHRDDPYDFTGEIDLFCRRFVPGTGDDGQFLRVATIRHDGVTFYVPAVSGELLRSNNGRYRLVMQGDGNLVVYDDGEEGRPIWSSWHGVL